MKGKLLLILWASLFFVIGVSIFVFAKLQEREHSQLIDSAIASHTNLLFHSRFVDLFFYNPFEVEEMVQDVLGGYRAGLFLALRNPNGSILYENKNIRMLNFDPDWTIEWQTFYEENVIFRLLSRKLPNGRFLQVGLLVNKNYFEGGFSQTTILILLAIWLSLSFFIAYVLSSRLFRPIESLTSEISYLTYNLDIEHLERALASINTKSNPFNPLKGWKDEFEGLKGSFIALLKQISTAIKLNSSNSARLIHEVNTPLTVIRNKVSLLRSTTPESIKAIVDDIDNLADFVRRYLQWAETTYTPLTSTELYAIPLEKFIRSLVNDLNPISKNRLHVTGHTDQNVFANKHELEHLLQNIITNALKYSPETSNVAINLSADTISVTDLGAGIPRHVLDRLGEPFNSGSKIKTRQNSGSGLGLAWIKAITQKYSWRLSIQSSELGTSVTITFASSSE